jgi:hypothetical protein
MPYNYLVDSSSRSQLSQINWDNAVIIVDEAHNIQVRLLQTFNRVSAVVAYQRQQHNMQLCLIMPWLNTAGQAGSLPRPVCLSAASAAYSLAAAWLCATEHSAAAQTLTFMTW